MNKRKTVMLSALVSVFAFSAASALAEKNPQMRDKSDHREMIMEQKYTQTYVEKKAVVQIQMRKEHFEREIMQGRGHLFAR